MELQDVQNKGKEYMAQGEYVLALEIFEKIGPDWMDNSEWIEKAEQEIIKLQEEGVCPYCRHNMIKSN